VILGLVIPLKGAILQQELLSFFMLKSIFWNKEGN